VSNTQDESPAIPEFDSVWLRKSIILLCQRLNWRCEIVTQHQFLFVTSITPTSHEYHIRVGVGAIRAYSRIVHKNDVVMANSPTNTVMAVFSLVLRYEIEAITRSLK
jgi:hypothetical protein